MKKREVTSKKVAWKHLKSVITLSWSLSTRQLMSGASCDFMLHIPSDARLQSAAGETVQTRQRPAGGKHLCFLCNAAVGLISLWGTCRYCSSSGMLLVSVNETGLRSVWACVTRVYNAGVCVCVCVCGTLVFLWESAFICCQLLHTVRTRPSSSEEKKIILAFYLWRKSFTASKVPPAETHWSHSIRYSHTNSRPSRTTDWSVSHGSVLPTLCL